MNFNNYWGDDEGRIWFKALVSFVIVCVMITWVIISLRTNATQLDFSVMMLVLGCLGINATEKVLDNRKNTNESTKEITPAAPAPVVSGPKLDSN
jgi:hypothetical protein